MQQHASHTYTHTHNFVILGNFLVFLFIFGLISFAHGVGLVNLLKLHVAQTRNLRFFLVQISIVSFISIPIRLMKLTEEKIRKEFHRPDMKFSVSVSFHSEITLERLLFVCDLNAIDLFHYLIAGFILAFYNLEIFFSF